MSNLPLGTVQAEFRRMLKIHHNRESAFKATFDALNIPESERTRYRGALADAGMQASLRRIETLVTKRNHRTSGIERSLPRGDRDDLDED